MEQLHLLCFQLDVELSYTRAGVPPGRLRLSTRPNLIGSTPTPKTIGMVLVAPLAASTDGVLIVASTANVQSNQMSSQVRQLVIISVGPSVLNRNIPAFVVTSSAKALTKRRHKMCRCVGGCGVRISNHRHPGLLRARRERPRTRGGAKNSDEFASPHRSSSREHRTLPHL